MSLLRSYREPCCRLTAVVSDEPAVRFEKGASFSAAILFANHGLLTEEKEEPDHLRCSVTVDKSVELSYGEMFLRESDRWVYRVLSDSGESETPRCAGLKLRQYRAERIYRWNEENGEL